MGKTKIIINGKRVVVADWDEEEPPQWFKDLNKEELDDGDEQQPIDKVG